MTTVPSTDRKVRVLIVDDSGIVRDVLKQMLETDSDIRVIGMASTGQEAVTLTAQLRPDLITMDIKMPGMDGMEATAKIMAHSPTPVLIVTSYIDREGTYSTMEVLSAGALDVMEKPSIVPSRQWESLTAALTEKVKILSRVQVITHLQGRVKAHPRAVHAPLPTADIVGIGVSTGGPRVLSEVCSALPSDFSLATVIVQHIARGFMKGLIGWLQPLCKVPLKIASDGDRILPGRILFAPEHAHLTVAPDRTVRLSHAPPLNGHRPSADVTLKSLSEAYGRRAVGVLLTGMGSDGADGLRAIHDAKGLTLVQSEESCVVFGMPKAAIERGAAQRIVSPPELIECLLGLHRARARPPNP